jgi:hypothetical protein
MRNGTIGTLCPALILGPAFAIASCSRKKEPNEAQDLESVRAHLREQVARGEPTREEAIVRLAEARVEYGSKKKEEGSELSPELEAYGEELKERVAKGELTPEEAKAAWIEAAKEAKASAKKPRDAIKEE